MSADCLRSLIVITLVALGGCDFPEMEEDEAPSARDEFFARARGGWVAEFAVGDPSASVFATDRYTFDDGVQTIEVEVFLDEDRRRS